MTSRCSCDAEGEARWNWNEDWKPYVRMKHQASVFTINKCNPNALLCVVHSSLMNTGSFFYSNCISNKTSISPFNRELWKCLKVIFELGLSDAPSIHVLLQQTAYYRGALRSLVLVKNDRFGRNMWVNALPNMGQRPPKWVHVNPHVSSYGYIGLH